MGSTIRLWLTVTALLIGSLLAACNGGGIEAGGEAFEDIPLPEGAAETETFTVSPFELPFLFPLDAGINAETYDQVTMKKYEVDASPEELYTFYQDNRGDWQEAFNVSTDLTSTVIWIKDSGVRTAWIVTAEGSESGATDLTVAEAHLEE